jgi:UDP-N-acetylglucosamine 2-epimerase (non-hydrolysing)
MIKVLSVFGTRPEAVKMAPVVKELQKYPGQINSRVCVTAQHREMLDQVLNLFEISPDHDLDLMSPNQTLGQLTAGVLTNLMPVIEDEQPDWLLVQGDTTTVMAASLAAFYAGVKVGHVEAGLRTHDKRQPFPEEINRRVAGVVADLHFAPTTWARDNLLCENVPPEQVVITGNTVIDALLTVADKPYNSVDGPLVNIPWHKRIILITAHRRENFGQPLENICNALLTFANRYQDQVHLVYPVHLNPNVQQPVYRILGDKPNITLLPPLDYHPLVYSMKNSFFVVTDSGGIQEEAPSLGKPVLVLRAKTERPEGVAAGTVKLVGTDPDTILNAMTGLFDDEIQYQRMAGAINPYGDGCAAVRIVKHLMNGV